MARWGDLKELQRLVDERHPSLAFALGSGGVAEAYAFCTRLGSIATAFTAALDPRRDAGRLAVQGEEVLTHRVAAGTAALIVQPHTGVTQLLICYLLSIGRKVAVFSDKRNLNADWSDMQNWVERYFDAGTAPLRVIAVPDFAAGLEARRALQEGFIVIWLPDDEKPVSARRAVAEVDLIDLHYSIAAPFYDLLEATRCPLLGAVTTTDPYTLTSSVTFVPLQRGQSAPRFYETVYQFTHDAILSYPQQWQLLGSWTRFFAERQERGLESN